MNVSFCMMIKYRSFFRKTNKDFMTITSFQFKTKDHLYRDCNAYVTSFLMNLFISQVVQNVSTFFNLFTVANVEFMPKPCADAVLQYWAV